MGMVNRRKLPRDVTGLAATLLLLAWVVRLMRRPPTDGGNHACNMSREAPQLQAQRAELVPGREDFSFLLAILTGVALSTGVVALQKVIEVASLTVGFAELVVFWLTSFGAVALIYLSVKYGSVFISGRIDAAENIMMMIVTLAECAMFIAVAMGPGPLLPLRWFTSLAAFAFSAGVTTAIVWRRLRREARKGAADKETVTYTKSLASDIRSAFGLFTATVLFVYFWPHPADLVSLGAGLVTLLILLRRDL
jgi:hypothetical protein